MTADQVLVVEDDLPIGTLIMRALERAGYKTDVLIGVVDSAS